MTIQTVYVSIGNSDDKLSQRRWSEFVEAVTVTIGARASTIHGAWVSRSDSAYQNACWCVEISTHKSVLLQATLTDLACNYGQDSVAWAVARTELLRPGPGHERCGGST